MKKGISLITLIIVIVVVVILAGAIILSVGTNNPMKNASKSKVFEDVNTFRAELTTFLSKQYSDTDGLYDYNELDGIVENELEEVVTTMKKSKNRIC